MEMVDGQTVEQPNATTPTPGTVDNGTQIPKFKSAEDRDQAYTELERQSHAQAQELAELKRQMADYAASQQLPSRQEPQPTFTDQYKSEKELKEFWNRFAQKPEEVFGEWAQKTLAAAEERLAAREHARDVIAEFKAKNPDLASYEEIVTIFVNRQPTNLSARDRLERAAPEARKMIASIAQRGTTPTGAIDNSTFVEAPSSNRGNTSRTVAQPAAQEDALTEYLREHETMMAKKQTPPRVTKG